MHKTFLTEVAGRWIVFVEGEGGRQEYLCETFTQAQRWLSLFGGSTKHPEQGHLKGRAEG